MTWWCVARSEPWNWTWQAYPGAWIFVAVVAAWYVAMVKRSDTPPPNRLFVVAALVALWVASDWPIGALGAGYLVSAHTLQYLLYAMVAPPLLMLAIPPASWRSPAWPSLLRFVTRPIPALLIFTLIVFLTHVPTVVDRLMQAQLGSFAIDMAWFVSGLIVWWPALAADPDAAHLSPPLRIGYLFLVSMIPGGPAVFMTFAEYPIYELYELAPRVTSLSAGQDQQLGGLMMKIAGFFIVLLAMSLIYIRWQRVETSEADEMAIPAFDPPR